MTDTRHLHDDDLGALVRGAGSPAGIDFRADLRARLAAAIDGDVELDPVRPADRRRTWLPIVAAAAVVALVVGTIAVIARERDPELGQAADLATQLVGPTWVALDVDGGRAMATLQMKIGATRPDVILLTGNDGCNEHSGEFRLDGTTIVGTILANQVGCPGVEPLTMPTDGASLTLESGVLTVSAGGRSTAFTALSSLTTASGSELDGLWAAGPARIQITDGQVTSDADVDGISIDLARALAVGTAEAWSYGESLIVRTPTTGLRRLDPAGPASSTDLAAQLAGHTWVAVDWPDDEQLPYLQIDRVEGTTYVTGSDSCEGFIKRFDLDGARVLNVERQDTPTAELCPDTVAATIADGAEVALDGPTLAISASDIATTYVALDTLPTVTGGQLDGAWLSSTEEIVIDAGLVTSMSSPQGFGGQLAIALQTDMVEAWETDGSMIVRSPRFDGIRRLRPAGDPAPSNLLDELVGRTWVGVGGDWQTPAPTLVFDSLNREPGLSAVSMFDGCNSGEGTFELEGATMVRTDITVTDAGCEHEIAHLTDGTNLAVSDGSLAVTSTSGLTTFYVAIDSLEPVPDTDLPAALDGVWEFAGSVFTIDGDTIGSQGSTTTAVWELLSGTVNSPGVEAWRRDRDLVLRDGSTFLVLVRSDLPVGGSPVVTTGPLDMAEEALILGTVTLEDGCLVTTLEGIRYPLVWQPGTTWNGVDTVILPDGVSVPMGQAIEAGGGYHSADGLGGFGIDPAGIDTMRGCAERIGPEIAVIQSPVTLQFSTTDGG